MFAIGLQRGQRVRVLGSPERFTRAGDVVEAAPPTGTVVTSVDVERVVVSFDDGTLAVVEVRLLDAV
jgi:hypothetical protein